MEDEEVGYCQGMCDLLAPFMVIAGDDPAAAHALFAPFVQRYVGLGIAMDSRYIWPIISPGRTHYELNLRMCNMVLGAPPNTPKIICGFRADIRFKARKNDNITQYLKLIFLRVRHFRV